MRVVEVSGTRDVTKIMAQTAIQVLSLSMACFTTRLDTPGTLSVLLKSSIQTLLKS